MNKKSVCLALLAALLLAACNSEPSAGDIKDNLNRLIGTCNHVLSVSNVEKTNGRKGDAENLYVVNLKYTVTYKPLTAEFDKIYNEAREAAVNFNSEIDPKHVEELKQRIAQLVAQINANSTEIYDLQNGRNSRCATDACYKQYTDAFVALEQKNQAMGQEKAKLEQEVYSMQPVVVPAKESLVKEYYKPIAARCNFQPAVERIIPFNSLLGGYYLKNILEEKSAEMSGEITMIKTEKGWMFQGFL